MGASSSLRSTRTFSSSSSTEECQGIFNNRRQQKVDDRKQHTDGRNVNNAHNRYSNHDVGTDYIPTSLFNGRRSNNEVTILRMSVGIENKSITTDEASKSVLKYKTPHFRAKAILEIPTIEEGKKIEVGWIQVCHSMHCVNVYGKKGLTSWEFPEIVLGKVEMVSDSDGKQYPWYGTKHELQTVEGPTDQPSQATVIMHDNFFPQITWSVPVKGHSRQARLTNIYRKQKFFTFLAVRRVEKDAHSAPIRILHAVEWTMEVDIVVDPTLPLGNRVGSIRPKSQEQVAILDVENHPLLRDSAMKPPNANNSQTLIWRPFKESSDDADDAADDADEDDDDDAHRASVVVKPLHRTMHMDTYLERTKEFGRRLVDKWTPSIKVNAPA